MGETLANLDTLYVLLIVKWIYCHMYQGNSQGSGKLTIVVLIRRNVSLCLKARVVSKQAGGNKRFINQLNQMK